MVKQADHESVCVCGWMGGSENREGELFNSFIFIFIYLDILLRGGSSGCFGGEGEGLLVF